MAQRFPLQKLISHSPDLLRLWDEGLVLEIHSGNLIVHNIPYMKTAKTLGWGKLITPLSLMEDQSKTTKPENHVMYMHGETPCDKNGNPLTKLITQNWPAQKFTDEITLSFHFSQKPTHGQGYADYYEKVNTYIGMISTTAKKTFGVTEKSHGVPEPDPDSDYPLRYLDSNASRAEITYVTEKVRGTRIAIVGLGGTGSYVLDYMAKTLVAEIHLYDGDILKTHNAFRAPGACSIEDFKRRVPKVTYYAEIYSNMHKGIVPHDFNLDATNIGTLKVDFVFVCVDRASSRKLITDYLINNEIPFIDVGIGVNLVDDKLMGTVRTTTVTAEERSHAHRLPLHEGDNNDYRSNIQIAELNSLNAGFAVLKWKKMIGMYHDLENEFHTAFSIEMNTVFNYEN